MRDRGLPRRAGPDRGDRRPHGRVHAVRPRRCVPRQARASRPGDPGHGRDRPPRRRPGLRALAGRHRPVQDRRLAPGRERAARAGGPVHGRSRPRADGHPALGRRPDAADRSGCSRRSSTAWTRRARRTSIRSRRSPSWRSPRATASRPRTSGSGPVPAWARSPSGGRWPGASTATPWPATRWPRARPRRRTSRRATSRAAAAAATGTGSTPRRRPRRWRRRGSTCRRRSRSTSRTDPCRGSPTRPGWPPRWPTSSRPTSG